MASPHSSRVWGVLEQYPGFNDSPEVIDFLEMQGHDELERFAEGFDYMKDHCTPSFWEAGQTPTGTAIPTSYQESPNVVHALTLYGIQRQRPDTRIVGYLNWPEYRDRQDTNVIRKKLDGFIKQNPHIPFGYFEGSEQLPLCIGNVRGLPTNMLNAIVASNATLFNHDADTRDMSPTHMFDMHREHQERGIGALLANTINEQLPHQKRLNQLLTWFDDLDIRHLQRSMIEPGPTYTANKFREVGGYTPKFLGETSDVIRSIAECEGLDITSDCWVQEAKLVLSARRLISKLKSGVGLDNIWDGAGDFKAIERYRNITHQDLQTIEDITPEERDEHLRAYGAAILKRIKKQHEFNEDGTFRPAEARRILEDKKDRIGGPDDMFVFDKWWS